MQHDDAPLVLRALNGDHEAYGQLYDRYARLVRAICYGATGDLEAAQDLAQEVFLRAYQKLARLKSPDRFAPCLVAMSKNVGREFRRSRARDRHQLVGLAPEETPKKSEERSDDRLERLNAAIDRLPEKQRLALRVYYLQDQDLEQATKALNMSRSSFYRLLQKARKNVEEIVLEQERVSEE